MEFSGSLDITLILIGFLKGDLRKGYERQNFMEISNCWLWEERSAARYDLILCMLCAFAEKVS